MLINDHPALSYAYYLPPTFVRMMGAHLSDELEPLPKVHKFIYFEQLCTTAARFPKRSFGDQCKMALVMLKLC